MTQLKELHTEFKALQLKLFGSSMFVVLDDNSEDTKRYEQLLAFFYPCYRTKDWINPVNSSL